MSHSQSASELLEQGIYTEETKGDIDSAIQIYRQIIEDAKGTRISAAQAQYRLGQCYHKKKKYSEAAAAFQKLIKDFPEQTVLVAKAKHYLPSELILEPVPWADGELMVMDLKFPSGFKIGGAAYAAHLTEFEGRKAWKLSTRTYAGSQNLSWVEVDPDTCRPIASRWKHTLIGDVNASYSLGQVTLTDNSKHSTRTMDLEGTVYDNEEAVQMMRRLPMAPGYKTTLPLFPTFNGGITIRTVAEVTGKETIEVPAGKFECFKIDLNIKQTFWYSADANRYLVKFEAGGVAGELREVVNHPLGELTRFNSEALGVSFVAPPDWVLFVNEPTDNKKQAGIAISDPELAANTELEIFPPEMLKPESRASVRAWANNRMEREARPFKQFAIREESWNERNISGHPAVSVLADLENNGKKQVFYGTFVLSPSNSVQLSTYVHVEHFDAFKKNIDGILDHLQVK